MPACFTMALSLILGEAKLTATQMDTTAKVTLEQVEGGFAITAVHLDPQGQDPGHRPEDVRGTGQQGQGQLSPLSKVLKATIALDAALEA